MERLNTVLVANRGEIACRLIKTAKKLSIRTLAVYTEPDSFSKHVVEADEAFLLRGGARTAYLDGAQIIAIAKDNGVQAVLPGYGFLSENADFAQAVAAAGLVFAGPSAEAIRAFGLKHIARELAIQAGVPVVPGSNGLLASEDAAVSAAAALGYPVMLKTTAGGGGMGLLLCHDEAELRNNFGTAQSRGRSLFHNAGVFLERYFAESHHIEVQVFGNGLGSVVSIGERECSIQRRHQKVIEECPSPYVLRVPELRAKLTTCAIRLTESIRYGSAGTVEFLVDGRTSEVFFLEMNTRLQVEHGVTELCYGIDLVELMLRQADRQLDGKGGLDSDELRELQRCCLGPRGHAIEARVYAENPAKDFAPSPGLLQEVSWHTAPGSRIDSWVRAGMKISSDYDALLAKVMYLGSTRDDAIRGLSEVLGRSAIRGPPVNLEWLHAIVQDAGFIEGRTTTRFLDTCKITVPGIDILSGGSYTLVQDHPGRPSVGHGFGHAGPMDPIAFQTANILAGNPIGTEGLEITLTGPDMVFLGDAVIALCGPPVPARLDGSDLALWTRYPVRAGQRLTIGKLPSHCRVYLAIYKGLANVARWYGSKSTNPMVNVGGYQGRALKAGDFLSIVDAVEVPKVDALEMPRRVIPTYTSDWVIQVMSGPYEAGYLSPADITTLFQHTWEVSHNSARGGIRLLGPRPEFARRDGGEGGSHPSNVIEYGYPIGGLNWTGDEPAIFPVDAPDFGGFVCSHTVIKADMWKMGQLRAGDRVRFRRVGLQAALAQRRRHDDFLQSLASAVSSGLWEDVVAFDSHSLGAEATDADQDLVRVLETTSSRPMVSYRAGGDDYLLVDYGDGKCDLNHKCRATALQRHIDDRASGIVSPQTRTKEGAVVNMVGCGNSLAIFYDGLRLHHDDLVKFLVSVEEKLGDLRTIQLPNRQFRLPVTFTHKRLTDAIERYTGNQRSIASYLPDPFRFVAESNGMTADELKNLLLRAESVVIGVGFVMALPLCLPVDPRDRLRSPKMNPSRTYTPEGTFSWGGSSISIYAVDSPGGFMPIGMTVPGLDLFGAKGGGFLENRPWLFESMDQMSFYEVSEDEYDAQMTQFRAGTYHFEVQEGVFDMAAHNKLLRETAAEAEALQRQRARAQDAMAQREKAMLNKWLAEKDAGRSQFDHESALAEDPDLEAIEAPMNANVWKVLVEQSQRVDGGQIVAILEAMKMEISVNADSSLTGGTVVKLLVEPGDSIRSGEPIALVRRAG
ncbi:carboxyltransferase domain-containing protein [Hirsutella rhossiliensis]|uniref:Carboxyltransferase domain-containing protein n=1 Tax=Hirsutella rhossiliensis TaxID=111463 RepID=A0A9P8N1P1_9HYPO|nr:carboxyltransferase domain-containing protein [Hirsutella rhossiliensis]KAH0965229.1 carboxyltransferase domain-containing protein [Hirsutella rhossiliensis]